MSGNVTRLPNEGKPIRIRATKSVRAAFSRRAEAEGINETAVANRAVALYDFLRERTEQGATVTIRQVGDNLAIRVARKWRRPQTFQFIFSEPPDHE